MKVHLLVSENCLIVATCSVTIPSENSANHRTNSAEQSRTVCWNSGVHGAFVGHRPPPFSMVVFCCSPLSSASSPADSVAAAVASVFCVDRKLRTVEESLSSSSCSPDSVSSESTMPQPLGTSSRPTGSDWCPLTWAPGFSSAKLNILCFFPEKMKL